jgi:hypothetical protein
MCPLSGLNLTADFHESASPLDFYRLLLTDDVIKFFKAETSRYAAAVCAQKKAAGNLSPRSFFSTWKPVKLHIR